MLVSFFCNSVFNFIKFKAILLGAHKFKNIIFPDELKHFHLNGNSIFNNAFALNPILSDINIATQSFICLVCLFLSFYFEPFCIYNFRWDSFKQHIAGIYFGFNAVLLFFSSPKTFVF